MSMRMIDVCAGIGGASLAAVRAGIEVVGHVECDPFCIAVLEKNFPGVPLVRLLQEFRGDEFGPVDILCASIPCQPFSTAGRRAGASDERNLWPELRRVVSASCGRGSAYSWVVVENVRGLLSIVGDAGDKGGFFKEIVLDLAKMGYRVGWAVYGASEVGAPHRRERVFLVAHYDHAGQWKRSDESESFARCVGASDVGEGGHLAYSQGVSAWGLSIGEESKIAEFGIGGELADSSSSRLQEWGSAGFCAPGAQVRTGMDQRSERCCSLADADCQRWRAWWAEYALQWGQGWIACGCCAGGLADSDTTGSSQWDGESGSFGTYAATARTSGDQGETQSGLGGATYGVSGWMDEYQWPSRPGEQQYVWEYPRVIPKRMKLADRVSRLKALGNSLVAAQLYPLLVAIVAERVIG